MLLFAKLVIVYSGKKKSVVHLNEKNLPV